jgi:hypothetical protein
LILEVGKVVTVSVCFILLLVLVVAHSFCIVPTFVVVVGKLCAVSATKAQQKMLAFSKKMDENALSEQKWQIVE